MKNDRNYDRPHAVSVKPTDVVLLRLRDAVSGLPHVLRVGVVSKITGARVYYRHPTTSQEEWTLKDKVLAVFPDVEAAELVRRTITKLAVDHARRMSEVNNETANAFESLVAAVQKTPEEVSPT